MSKIKATVFRHISQEGLGSFHRILSQRGYDVTYVTVSREDLSQYDALEPDVMLVMGGPIGVYQSEDYPFLEDEIRIIKERIAAGKPTFGVCLGSQLIAKALGSKVYKGDHGAELGWAPIQLTEAAKGTIFEHLSPENTNMFHWHGDTFDLPEGATLMASSAQYKNQIYTYGDHICGVQCHPEVTEKGLKEWWVFLVNDVTGENAAMPIAQVRRETAQYAEKLNEQATKFFNAWLDEQGL